jgi:hypothetical protein
MEPESLFVRLRVPATAACQCRRVPPPRKQEARKFTVTVGLASLSATVSSSDGGPSTRARRRVSGPPTGPGPGDPGLDCPLASLTVTVTPGPGPGLPCRSAAGIRVSHLPIPQSPPGVWGSQHTAAPGITGIWWGVVTRTPALEQAQVTQ